MEKLTSYPESPKYLSLERLKKMLMEAGINTKRFGTIFDGCAPPCDADYCIEYENVFLDNRKADIYMKEGDGINEDLQTAYVHWKE